MTRPDSDHVIGSATTSLSSQLLHDLRSPLNQIIGYSEMLAEEAQGQASEDLQKIRAAGHRILALIEENFTSGLGPQASGLGSPTLVGGPEPRGPRPGA